MLPIWDTINNFWQLLLLYQKLQRLCTVHQMLSFCLFLLRDVDHKCCKKSRQKITIFHAEPLYIFMWKFSRDTIALFVVVQQHRQDWPNSFKPFFGFHRVVVKIDFLLYFVAFLFTCQNTLPIIKRIIFHFLSIIKGHFKNHLLGKCWK